MNTEDNISIETKKEGNSYIRDKRTTSPLEKVEVISIAQ